jgi:hypothetical protein
MFRALLAASALVLLASSASAQNWQFALPTATLNGVIHPYTKAIDYWFKHNLTFSDCCYEDVGVTGLNLDLKNLVVIHDHTGLSFSSSAGEVTLAADTSLAAIGQYDFCFQHGDSCTPITSCSGNFEIELNATASVKVKGSADASTGHLALVEDGAPAIALTHFDSTLCKELSFEVETALKKLIQPVSGELEKVLDNALAVANSFFPLVQPVNITGHELALYIAAAPGTTATSSYLIFQAISSVEVGNETSPSFPTTAFPTPTDGKAHIRVGEGAVDGILWGLIAENILSINTSGIALIAKSGTLNISPASISASFDANVDISALDFNHEVAAVATVDKLHFDFAPANVTITGTVASVSIRAVGACDAKCSGEIALINKGIAEELKTKGVINQTVPLPPLSPLANVTVASGSGFFDLAANIDTSAIPEVKIPAEQIGCPSGIGKIVPCP